LVKEFLLEGLHLKGILGEDFLSGKGNSGGEHVVQFLLLLDGESVDVLLFSSDESSLLQEIHLSDEVEVHWASVFHLLVKIVLDEFTFDELLLEEFVLDEFLLDELLLDEIHLVESVDLVESAEGGEVFELVELVHGVVLVESVHSGHNWVVLVVEGVLVFSWVDGGHHLFVDGGDDFLSVEDLVQVVFLQHIGLLDWEVHHSWDHLLIDNLDISIGDLLLSSDGVDELSDGFFLDLSSWENSDISDGLSSEDVLVEHHLVHHLLQKEFVVDLVDLVLSEDSSEGVGVWEEVGLLGHEGRDGGVVVSEIVLSVERLILVQDLFKDLLVVDLVVGGVWSSVGDLLDELDLGNDVLVEEDWVLPVLDERRNSPELLEELRLNVLLEDCWVSLHPLLEKRDLHVLAEEWGHHEFVEGHQSLAIEDSVIGHVSAIFVLLVWEDVLNQVLLQQRAEVVLSISGGWEG